MLFIFARVLLICVTSFTFFYVFFNYYYFYLAVFRLLFLLLLLHFVLLCFTVYQIEMAIETLQKSEGLSSQRSSLLNSHVSCFSPVLAFASLLTLPHSLCCLSFSPTLSISRALSFLILPLSLVFLATFNCYSFFLAGCCRIAFCRGVTLQALPDGLFGSI